MERVSFFAEGGPAPKGSTKSFRNARTVAMVTMGDCARTKPWQKVVATFAMQAAVQKASGPVRLELDFFFSRPRYHYGRGKNEETVKERAPVYHGSKPDLDKLIRSVLDALTGIAYADDSQVVEVRAGKRYCASPSQPEGVAVVIVC